MPDNEIEALLDYVERTDLALFEYILVELNDAYFAEHSWQAAEAFLQLKSLASFPESLAKAVLLNGANQIASGLQDAYMKVFPQSIPLIWKKYAAVYSKKGCLDATDAKDFGVKLSSWVQMISGSSSEEKYLAASLSLSTLLRNFTSHWLVEDVGSSRSQYVSCVRAILTATFLIWKVAQLRHWV
jgi:hypothetical protein